MIAEALPIIAAFLPLIGISLMGGALTGAGIGYSRWNKRASQCIIEDLKRLAEFGKTTISRARDGQPTDHEALAEFIVALSKYEKLIPIVKEETLDNDQILFRIHRCAAIFHNKGYVRARLKIWRENRRLPSQMSANILSTSSRNTEP